MSVIQSERYLAEYAERILVQSTKGDQDRERMIGRWFSGTSFGRFRGRCKRFRIVSNDVFCIAVSKHHTVELSATVLCLTHCGCKSSFSECSMWELRWTILHCNMSSSDHFHFSFWIIIIPLLLIHLSMARRMGNEQIRSCNYTETYCHPTTRNHKTGNPHKL
jgi:hypothetical protein